MNNIVAYSMLFIIKEILLFFFQNCFFFVLFCLNLTTNRIIRVFFFLFFFPVVKIVLKLLEQWRFRTLQVYTRKYIIIRMIEIVNYLLIRMLGLSIFVQVCSVLSHINNIYTVYNMQMPIAVWIKNAYYYLLWRRPYVYAIK